MPCGVVGFVGSPRLILKNYATMQEGQMDIGTLMRLRSQHEVCRIFAKFRICDNRYIVTRCRFTAQSLQHVT